MQQTVWKLRFMRPPSSHGMAQVFTYSNTRSRALAEQIKAGDCYTQATWSLNRERLGLCTSS